MIVSVANSIKNWKVAEPIFMNRRFLEILICPVCSQYAPLHAVDADVDSHDQVNGELRCERCGATYPVYDGNSRFAGDDCHDCGNYTFQWREWRTVQIDRLGHRDLSERQFFGNTRCTPGWLRGRLILYAAAENLRDNDESVACLQPSIHDLPSKFGSLEVVQYTPNPTGTVEALSQVLVRMFFPRIRLLSPMCYIRFANHFARIAATHPVKSTRVQQYRWTLLDTIYCYGLRYEQRQDHRKVIALLEDPRLFDVAGASELAWAR